MSTPGTIAWIRVGLTALPASGLLTVWATFTSQPDQVADPEAWAGYVVSASYVLSHTFGTIGGAVLAILGVIALGAHLANGRAGRLALTAMVATVVGQALGLVVGGISAYAIPAIGRAYLAGTPEVMAIEFPAAMTAVFMLALLFMLLGNALLGVAVWRSDALPKGAGAAWLVSALLFYVLGAVLGMATTGASLPTQPIGAALMALAGAWIAWSAFRKPSLVTAGAAPHPSTP